MEVYLGLERIRKKMFENDLNILLHRFSGSVLYSDAIASPVQSRRSDSTNIHRPTHQVP